MRFMTAHRVLHRWLWTISLPLARLLSATCILNPSLLSLLLSSTFDVSVATPSLTCLSKRVKARLRRVCTTSSIRIDTNKRKFHYLFPYFFPFLRYSMDDDKNKNVFTRRMRRDDGCWKKDYGWRRRRRANYGIDCWWWWSYGIVCCSLSSVSIKDTCISSCGDCGFGSGHACRIAELRRISSPK